jgi:hypothetical protein
MRRIRFAVVAALLFSALALSEFPELLQLKDDTANDFALLVSKQDLSRTNNTAKPGPTPAAILVREVSIHTPVSDLLALPFLDTLARSSNDYLHLLCVHRT